MNLSASQPARGRVLRTLKEGNFDRTEVIELPDGECRVRKRTKVAACGPWGPRTLRREILYLTSLPEPARADFPPVLAAWDDNSRGAPDIGYEMPFYSDCVDAGELARRGMLTQDGINEFQDALAEAVLGRLHEPVAADESLAAHVTLLVEQVLEWLEMDPVLAPLIHAESIELNGMRLPGPRTAFERIKCETNALAALDAGPAMRLHGDLFLENILWRPAAIVPGDDAPRLILIDPVSVAGVTCGPPLFDLVKYISYATGELPALRSEWVEVGGFDAAEGATPAGAWHYRIRWEDAALQPFLTFDWHRRFQRAFEARYGAVDRRLYQLINGYFNTAMSVNTAGVEQRARLLKATVEFNAVLTPSD